MNNNQDGSKFQAQETAVGGHKREFSEQEDPNERPTKYFCVDPNHLKCVAVLPGIPGVGEYFSGDSSSTTDSSDSSDDNDENTGRDISGGKLKQKCSKH